MHNVVREVFLVRVHGYVFPAHKYAAVSCNALRVVKHNLYLPDDRTEVFLLDKTVYLETYARHPRKKVKVLLFSWKTVRHKFVVFSLHVLEI